MIVIVDNGQEYSDHRMYFVEADGPAAVLVAMDAGVDRFWSDGQCPREPGETEVPEHYRTGRGARIVGTTADILWLHDEPHQSRGEPAAMSLEDFRKRLAEGDL